MRRWLVLGLVLFLTTPALAGRAFESGFEELSPGQEAGLLGTVWSAVNGAVEISTAQKHSGSNSLRVNASAAVINVSRTLGTPQTDGEQWARLYIRIVTFPGSNTVIWRWLNSGSSTVAQVYVTNSGTLIMQNGAAGATDTCTVAMSTGVWYRLEQRYFIHDTDGQLELRRYIADSTTADDICGIGTFTGGSGANDDTFTVNVNSQRFGTISSNTMEVYFDDFGWNQCTVANQPCTDFQEGWLGPGKIATLKPLGETSATWTPTSGTDNALMLDEMPAAVPDDATTEVTDTTAGNIDQLTMTDLGAEVTSDAVIRLLSVYGRTDGTSTAGAGTMRWKLWDHTPAVQNGPTANMCDRTAYGIIATDAHFTYDATTPTITKANVTSFNVGYENISGDDCAITAVWINTEWIEASAPPAVGGSSLLLMGVGQ